MYQDFDFGGFEVDPYGPSDYALGSGLYNISVDTPSYVDSAPFISSVSYSAGTPLDNSPSFSLPDFNANDVFNGLTRVLDFGLKTNAALKGAEVAVKNSELQTYLAKNQFEVMRTKSTAEIELAKENAIAQKYMAQAKSAAALSTQNAANFGTQGGSGVMLWLTVLGVAFAAIQVWNSAK